MAAAQERLSTETIFSVAGDALGEAVLATERDWIHTARLGPVEEAMRRFCREPNETTRSKLTAAVADLREARRSTALARWRGLASRHDLYRKVNRF
jgi:hypothetical protein